MGDGALRRLRLVQGRLSPRSVAIAADGAFPRGRAGEGSAVACCYSSLRGVRRRWVASCRAGLRAYFGGSVVIVMRSSQKIPRSALTRDRPDGPTELPGLRSSRRAIWTSRPEGPRTARPVLGARIRAGRLS